MADENTNIQQPAAGQPQKADPRSMSQADPRSDQQANPRSASQGTSQQPQPRPCPQDCSRCSTQQHIFCSTKMLFDLSRAFQESRRQQAEIVQTVAEIQEQLKPKEQEAQLSIPFDGEA